MTNVFADGFWIGVAMGSIGCSMIWVIVCVALSTGDRKVTQPVRRK